MTLEENSFVMQLEGAKVNNSASVAEGLGDKSIEYNLEFKPGG